MKRRRPGTTQPASNQPPDLQQLAIDPARVSRRIRKKNLLRCSTTWRILTLRSLRSFSLGSREPDFFQRTLVCQYIPLGLETSLGERVAFRGSTSRFCVWRFLTLRSLRPLRFETRVVQRTHVLKFDTHLWAAVPHCCETPTPQGVFCAPLRFVFSKFLHKWRPLLALTSSISRSWWVRFLVS